MCSLIVNSFSYTSSPDLWSANARKNGFIDAVKTNPGLVFINVDQTLEKLRLKKKNKALNVGHIPMKKSKSKKKPQKFQNQEYAPQKLQVYGLASSCTDISEQELQYLKQKFFSYVPYSQSCNYYQ
jgi:hypothetical protein